MKIKNSQACDRILTESTAYIDKTSTEAVHDIVLSLLISVSQQDAQFYHTALSSLTGFAAPTDHDVSLTK